MFLTNGFLRLVNAGGHIGPTNPMAGDRPQSCGPSLPVCPALCSAQIAQEGGSKDPSPEV